MTRAYLALGANLGEPMKTLEAAIRRLEGDDLSVVARAPIYRSAPVGPPGQPDYLNTAIAVETELSPRGLLRYVKSIEVEAGRTAGVRWGPRVLDIDIILYGAQVVDEPDLIIPHKEMHWRRFVLAPLADIAADELVPGADRTVSGLLDALDDDPSDVVRLDSGP